MKKFSLLALAAAGLLFGACSEKDELTASQEQQQVWNENGNGYLSVSINLPVDRVSSTRAKNDVYDDGTAEEYEVNSALLVLFHNAASDTQYGSDAKFLGYYPLTLPQRVKDADNDNITTSYQVTTEIGEQVKNNLFALVLVNYEQVISASDFNSETSPKLVFDGATPYTVTTSTTIGDLQAHISNAAFYTAASSTVPAKNFFMTNAVLSSAIGGISGTAPLAATAPTKSNIFVLSKLNTDNIKSTREEAEANPAGSIYVERAVAKATISTSATYVATEATANTIKSIEWNIDNMEPTSMLVRNMGTLSPDYLGYSSNAFTTPYYRMVGNTQMGTTAIQPQEAFYRTYWCIDPQYNVAAPTMTAAASYYPSSQALYCHENTFNVANQNYRNTTRANLKVTINNGTTFYTINDADVLSTAAGVNTALANVIMANSDIKKLYDDNLNEGKSYTMAEADFVITLTDKNANGIKTVSDIDFSSAMKTTIAGNTTFKTTMAFLTGTEKSDLIAELNASVKIKEFTNGIMYYEARFQHFANTYHEASFSGTWNEAAQNNALNAGNLAPWKIWESAESTTDPAPTSASAYPIGTPDNSEKNYLGRWGMVRNNWYDVQVTAFNKFGDPVPTNITGSNTPDDNIRQYISVKINVLSWAKRTQQWSF